MTAIRRSFDSWVEDAVDRLERYLWRCCVVPHDTDDDLFLKSESRYTELLRDVVVDDVYASLSREGTFDRHSVEEAVDSLAWYLSHVGWSRLN